MKNNFKINFRSPNVDRVIEILLFAIWKDDREFGFEFFNLPSFYPDLFRQLKLPYNHSMKPHFFIQYQKPQKIKFDIDKMETFEAMKERIDKAIEFSKDLKINPILDNSCEALLNNAYNKLELSIDQISELLELSQYITWLDNSNKIEAQHIAEAIQYSINPSNEN